MLYSVGKPICFQFGSYSGKVTKKTITKQDVKDSILTLTKIKIFFSLEDAECYARSLRIHNSLLATPLHRNSVAPLFTLTLKNDNNLILQSEHIEFIDYSSFSATNQKKQIKYAETSPSNILELSHARFLDVHLPDFDLHSSMKFCAYV